MTWNEEKKKHEQNMNNSVIRQPRANQESSPGHSGASTNTIPAFWKVVICYRPGSNRQGDAYSRYNRGSRGGEAGSAEFLELVHRRGGGPRSPPTTIRSCSIASWYVVLLIISFVFCFGLCLALVCNPSVWRRCKNSFPRSCSNKGRSPASGYPTPCC